MAHVAVFFSAPGKYIAPSQGNTYLVFFSIRKTERVACRTHHDRSVLNKKPMQESGSKMRVKVVCETYP